jgi:DNA-binding transcriptional regulator YhcF (GntR family)
MLLQLDFYSEAPIYLQIRNQIVMDIAEGRLKVGERLPSIRTLAAQSGINVMTVNKAYAFLKGEGYITVDRRHGAAVADTEENGSLSSKWLNQLRLIAAEARLSGMKEEDFLSLSAKIFNQGGGENG